MNKPVNPEIAKLLKEKGFNEECRFYYSSNTNQIEEFEYYHIDRKYSDYTGYPEDVLYFIPNIAEVVMWLYEKHSIWIVAWRNPNNSSKFYFEIDSLTIKIGDLSLGLFNSPTEAYEAAFEYVLTNDFLNCKNE